MTANDPCLCGHTRFFHTTPLGAHAVTGSGECTVCDCKGFNDGKCNHRWMEREEGKLCVWCGVTRDT